MVARFAADDAYPSEEPDARSLVEACRHCAALAAEIQLIRSAAASIPVAPRPRDFRLTAADADRLRGSALDRLLRRLTVPGLAPLRPVAAGVMSLGLALAVVGAALPAPAPADLNAAIFSEQQERLGAAPPGVDEPAEQPAGEPLPTGSEIDGEAAGAADDVTLESAQLEPADDVAALPVRDVLVIGGLLLTAAALAVLVAVALARRRWMDPLLR